jgi:hypothetical protein
MASVLANLSEDQLQYVINHIFLPPQLPQLDDSATQQILFPVVLEALSAFAQKVLPSGRQSITNILQSLSVAQTIHSDSNGNLSEPGLRSVLAQLKQQIPLHIEAQNCALIIRKIGDSVQFEAFELSARNESVMSKKGRLIRSFPEVALSIKTQVFQNTDFQQMLAQTLATMSTQKVSDMQPQSSKTGRSHDETRDTTNPSMVTVFLMKLLQSLGRGVDVSTITKNTRDDILWSNVKLPWRRSPLWTMIRVFLQLSFSKARVSPGSPHNLYKHFMLFLMSYIVDAIELIDLKSDLVNAMIAKITYRLHKIQGEEERHEEVQDFVKATLGNAGDLLLSRWKVIQNNDNTSLDLSQLCSLDFDRDSFVSVPALDQHILGMSEIKQATVASSFSPGSRLLQYDPHTLPSLSHQSFDNFAYVNANLLALETWISTHLDNWLESNKSDEKTCARLTDLLISYHNIASSLYSSNPETYSSMILMCFKLWTACDSVATTICPLLADYDPGLSSDVLKSLLLPLRADMEMLYQIEQHLDARSRRKYIKASELLYSTNSAVGFAARYFDQSPRHQMILESVKSNAQRDKARKLSEFNALQKEYADLERKISSIECETEDGHMDWLDNHSMYPRLQAVYVLTHA